MPKLYGKTYTKHDLLQRVGDISQLGGVERFQLHEGLEQGVEGVRFRTGTGLSFDVLLSRGMDISTTEYRGVPLVWRSPTERVAPTYYDPRNTGWLRSFHGGMLVTCGLTSVGSPSEDSGEELGLHGRISNIPASNTSVGGCWQDDDYLMWAEGQMKQAVVFGENLILHRRVEAKLGENRFFVHDRVKNLGFTTTPHMLLYHINLGFPLVDPETDLLLPSVEVTPRDQEAERDLQDLAKITEPQPAYQEKVYYHQMGQDAQGFTYVAVINRRLDDGLGIYLKYKRSQLPRFVQWKMFGQGTYVLGLEPANCFVEGRALERERGTLHYLQSQQERYYDLEIGVLTCSSEIDWIKERVADCK